MQKALTVDMIGSKRRRRLMSGSIAEVIYYKGVATGLQIANVAQNLFNR